MCEDPNAERISAQYNNDDLNKSLQGGAHKEHAKKMKMCMATPCNHYFHESCLKEWMNHKMECPTCRQQLPPW